MKLSIFKMIVIALCLPALLASAEQKIEKDTATYYIMKANAMAEKGQYDQALKELNKAIEKEPSSARAYKVRGHVFIAKGDNEKAIEDLNKVISLVPKAAKPYVDRSIVHFKMGNKGLATKDINKALSLKPDSAWAKGVKEKIASEK